MALGHTPETPGILSKWRPATMELRPSGVLQKDTAHHVGAVPNRGRKLAFLSLRIDESGLFARSTGAVPNSEVGFPHFEGARPLS